MISRYDALGRRVLVRTRADSLCSQYCVSAIERTVWDGDQILAEVRIPGGNDDYPDLPSGSGEQYGHVTYVHAGGIDAPLAILRGGSSLGDPLIVPHANWRGHYDRGTNSAGAEVPQSIAWPGKRLSAYLAPDADEHPGLWIGSLARGMADQSGLLYRRNRYYDPATGQFTQEDPIGLAGGLNLYGYAGGDPVSHSDPFGLCPEKRDDGKECNMETGDPYLDDPQIRQRLEDAYNQAPKDRMFPQLTAEVGGWCTMSQCRVRTGRYSHVAAGRRPKGTILHFHTHPNVGERHPIWNTRVFGSGPSDPDRKAARGRPVSSYIIEPDRIYILTPDGGLTCHGRWTNSPGCP